METYLLSLGQNDDLNLEWLSLRETDEYKFNPTRNYYYEALEMGLKNNKYSPDKMDENEFKNLFQERMFHSRVHDTSCNCVHKYMCDKWCPPTPEYIKNRIYKEWLGYKFQNFKRNYKPKNEDEGLNYLWLTFNYHKDTPMNVVKTDMARIVGLAVFDKCKLTYTYEYYTEKGFHPHVHMLVELKRTGTISPSTLKEKVFQYKKLAEYMSITYFYSWATGKNIKKRTNKRSIYNAYLLGNKKLLKEDNCEKDKEFRQLNELEELYIKDN